ncbi:SMP-30/gluconolactonase/LRE family protein [Oricola sp.]|uniref:SMP-30/gluconolactonase/LRE family protein n=1 Tax=Oricola sp. TaxID=1979950 RepID=UPI003BA8D3E7
MKLDPAIIHEGRDMLGEGPSWHPRRNELWWLDIENGVLNAWSDETGHRVVFKADYRVGCYGFTASDDLVLGTERGIERWHSATGRFDLLHAPEPDGRTRFNDGKVDPMGRFWAGTMPLAEEDFDKPLGNLYRFDPDGSLHTMETGLTISNGLDWFADGKTMILTDTKRLRIYAYDFDMATGAISSRREFIRTDPDHGIPDGLTIDADGDIWSAGISGGCLLRYAPSGALKEKIDIATASPTSVAFGGPALDRLYVTSARFHLKPGEEDRLAGSLAMIDPGCRGRPTNVFAG